jgi:hypothetical protein
MSFFAPYSSFLFPFLRGRALHLYRRARFMFEGLDQINIVAGPELKGSGETDLLLTVDGQIGNAVRINFQ